MQPLDECPDVSRFPPVPLANLDRPQFPESVQAVDRWAVNCQQLPDVLTGQQQSLHQFRRPVVRRLFGRAHASSPTSNSRPGFAHPLPAYRVGLPFATNYDYAGLSHQVVGERQGPWEDIVPGEPHSALVGDKFVSTYTYGPLGLITRTDEGLNADPTDNRDHYYLSDVHGGNIGLLMDDDADPETPRRAAFHHFDAFGNKMTKMLSAFGS